MKCPTPPATVVITTKNRKEDLRRAIASALEQTILPEIIVIDDGSTDGTCQMVLDEFPQIHLQTATLSRGYIVQRNVGARLASAPFIFSIDDDAEFASSRTIEQTLREFDDDRIGAVAIPFINVNQNQRIHQRADNPEHVQVSAWFIGTAHALRRDIFLDLGGYREILIHQGEESDYGVRLLNEGYVIRLGSADPIHHFESPRRDYRRMDYFGRRNDILFGWFNAPLVYLLPHWLATTWNGLRFGFKIGRPWRMAKGLVGGYLTVMTHLFSRKPVRTRSFKLFRRLRISGSLPFGEIAQGLPSPTMSSRFCES